MRSLKATLTVRLLLGGMLLLGLGAMAFHWRMRRLMTREFDEGLQLAAQSLLAFTENKDERLQMDSEVNDMPQFNRDRGTSVFLLTLMDGKEIRRSRSLRKQSLQVPGDDPGETIFFETTLEDGRHFRCLRMNVPGDADDDDDEHDAHPEAAVLTVGRSTNQMERTLGDIRRTLLVTGTLSLASLVALLLWGVKRGLSPLDQLVAAISTVNANSLETEVPVAPLPTELRPIAIRLNESLARLAKVFEREKRFTADVAHELRTPLAELRTLAEVNLMTPLESSEENSACWAEVKGVALRMESLSLRLLELARVDQPQQEIHREPVNIAALLARAWARFSSAADERGVRLESSVPAEVVWHSDPVLLDLAVSNLLGNAVQHAPPGSACGIATGPGFLSFSNAAGDLEEEDLPRLFDRFWKKDVSRSDGQRHGLGLSLAREIARLLGGMLEARLDDGQIIFTLDFPSEREP